MKALILAHAKAPESSSAEIHRFKFQLDDGNAEPYSEFISLRTARVIVDNLEDGNAFIKMLQSIVKTDPSEYDGLIGNVYPDHFTQNRDGHGRPVTAKDSEGTPP